MNLWRCSEPPGDQAVRARRRLRQTSSTTLSRAPPPSTPTNRTATAPMPSPTTMSSATPSPSPSSLSRRTTSSPSSATHSASPCSSSGLPSSSPSSSWWRSGTRTTPAGGASPGPGRRSSPGACPRHRKTHDTEKCRRKKSLMSPRDQTVPSDQT